jgi:CHAT domain-containing protein
MNTIATVEAGISSMSKYTCVHLACHATQDVKEPLKSGFHFHDGRLELSRIIQANLSFADFAFLSACQTSAGDEKFSEQAVHLAAGMLVAGYKGVVGTMWSIQDRYASEIAEAFYDHLLLRSAGTSVPDIDGQYAAEALHHAITQGIRRKLGDTPQSLLVWVPYVHFGL